MRLRIDMRRFIMIRSSISRLIEAVARRIARLFGRTAAAEPIRARQVEQPARRFTAVRPGSYSPAREASGTPDVNVAADAVFIAPDPAPLPFGDFTDRGEAERFAVLPPIVAGAGDDVDWDALARALTGER